MSLIVGTDDDAQIWELNSTNHQWERKWVFSDNSGIIRNVSWSSNYGKDYEPVATASSVIIEGQDNVQDGCIRIYEIRPTGMTMTACLRDHGRDVHLFVVCKRQVWRIEWNITGTILASSGDDNTVRMWKQKFDVQLNRSPDKQGTWECIEEIHPDAQLDNGSCLLCFHVSIFFVIDFLMASNPKKVLALFDVDGTLSESRKVWICFTANVLGSSS